MMFVLKFIHPRNQQISYEDCLSLGYMFIRLIEDRIDVLMDCQDVVSFF